jgi:hypothetical protein
MIGEIAKQLIGRRQWILGGKHSRRGRRRERGCFRRRRAGLARRSRADAGFAGRARGERGAEHIAGTPAEARRIGAFSISACGFLAVGQSEVFLGDITLPIEGIGGRRYNERASESRRHPLRTREALRHGQLSDIPLMQPSEPANK